MENPKEGQKELRKKLWNLIDHIKEEDSCDNCNNDVCCCTIRAQETLEEAAEKCFKYIDHRNTFIAGAKSDAAKAYWYNIFKQNL